MIAEAGAAISGIKVAMDMAKGIAALKTQTEINQAIIDIQRALLEAQSAALDDKLRLSELQSMITELKSKLETRDSWARDAQRYALTESEIGTFTYDLKPEFADGEVSHSLCVTCFGNGKKSILQGKGYLTCNDCGKTIQVKRSEPIQYTSEYY